MAETFTESLSMKLHNMLARCSYGAANFRHPERRRILKLILDSPIRAATTPLERFQLISSASACDKLDGDMAEAGVFRGGTAALMLQASSKHLHLFDTFAGLPDGENRFQQGDYAGSLHLVKRNLAPWAERVSFHPGFFPASASGLESLRFAFVHLDLDLYQSTLDALTWFWPRMNPGSVLLSHDYSVSVGVHRAFDEFFAARKEIVLPLSGDQCVAFKPA